MNTQNTIDPSLRDKIVGLMADCDDRRMWRNALADQLDTISQADDQALIRAGQNADGFEAQYQAFAGGHPGVQVTAIPDGGFQEFCLRLVKLDRATRNYILGAYAAELRKP